MSQTDPVLTVSTQYSGSIDQSPPLVLATSHSLMLAHRLQSRPAAAIGPHSRHLHPIAIGRRRAVHNGSPRMAFPTLDPKEEGGTGTCCTAVSWLAIPAG